MDKQYEYALIPIISLEILTFFWLLLFTSYFIIRLKYKKYKTKLSVRAFNDKQISKLKYPCSIKYQKMFISYSYSYKKALLKVNEKIADSDTLVDLLSAVKMFNDINIENTIYNGERVIFNISKILQLVRFIFIIPFLFNAVSVIFFIISLSLINNSTPNMVYVDLVKIFAVSGLTLFLFLWFIWAFCYDRYIKSINAEVYKFFSETEIKKINFLLKFHFMLLGIK